VFLEGQAGESVADKPVRAAESRFSQAALPSRGH